MENILDSVKRYLGIRLDFTHHDPQIITELNICLGRLNQLRDVKIDEDTIWSDITEDETLLEAVKLYITMYIESEIKRKLDNFQLTEAEKWQCTARWLNYLYRKFAIPKDDFVFPCDSCPICESKCGSYMRDYPQRNFTVLEKFTGPNTIVGPVVTWGIL